MIKKGLFIGKLHSKGGIKYNSEDSNKIIEVEGGEFYICEKLYNSKKIYNFTDKTNLQVLTTLFNDSNCEIKNNTLKNNDFIVCKLVVNDKKKYNRKGTIIEILNEMQKDKGCMVENNSSKLEKGGKVTVLNNKINVLNKTVTNEIKGLNILLKYSSINLNHFRHLIQKYSTIISRNVGVIANNIYTINFSILHFDKYKYTSLDESIYNEKRDLIELINIIKQSNLSEFEKIRKYFFAIQYNTIDSENIDFISDRGLDYIKNNEVKSILDTYKIVTTVIENINNNDELILFLNYFFGTYNSYILSSNLRDNFYSNLNNDKKIISNIPFSLFIGNKKIYSSNDNIFKHYLTEKRYKLNKIKDEFEKLILIFKQNDNKLEVFNENLSLFISTKLKYNYNDDYIQYTKGLFNINLDNNVFTDYSNLDNNNIDKETKIRIKTNNDLKIKRKSLLKEVELLTERFNKKELIDNKNYYKEIKVNNNNNDIFSRELIKSILEEKPYKNESIYILTLNKESGDKIDLILNENQANLMLMYHLNLYSKGVYVYSIIYNESNKAITFINSGSYKETEKTITRFDEEEFEDIQETIKVKEFDFLYFKIDSIEYDINKDELSITSIIDVENELLTDDYNDLKYKKNQNDIFKIEKDTLKQKELLINKEDNLFDSIYSISNKNNKLFKALKLTSIKENKNINDNINNILTLSKLYINNYAEYDFVNDKVKQKDLLELKGERTPVIKKFWNYNKEINIEELIAFFIMQGNKKQYRKLCIKILGFDYMLFYTDLIKYLFEKELLFVSIKNVDKINSLIDSSDSIFIRHNEISNVNKFKTTDNNYIRFENFEFIIEDKATFLSGHIIHKADAIYHRYTENFIGFNNLSNIILNKNNDIVNKKIEIIKKQFPFYNLDLFKKGEQNIYNEIYKEKNNRFIFNNKKLDIDLFTNLFRKNNGSTKNYYSYFKILKDFSVKITDTTFFNKYSRGDISAEQIKDFFISPKKDFELKLKYILHFGEITDRDNNILDFTGYSAKSLNQLIDSIYKNRDSDNLYNELYELNYVKINNNNKGVPTSLFTIYLTKEFQKIYTNVKIEFRNLFKHYISNNYDSIGKKFNFLYNNFIPKNKNKQPIFLELNDTFGDIEKNREFNLMPSQVDGLKSILSNNENSNLLLHEVGFGKTTTSIAFVNNLRNIKDGNTPLFLVPNAVYDKFFTEIKGDLKRYGLLPNSKVIGLGSLSKGDFKKFKTFTDKELDFINKFDESKKNIIEKLKLKSVSVKIDFKNLEDDLQTYIDKLIDLNSNIIDKLKITKYINIDDDYLEVINFYFTYITNKKIDEFLNKLKTKDYTINKSIILKILNKLLIEDKTIDNITVFDKYEVLKFIKELYDNKNDFSTIETMMRLLYDNYTSSYKENESENYNKLKESAKNILENYGKLITEYKIIDYKDTLLKIVNSYPKYILNKLGKLNFEISKDNIYIMKHDGVNETLISPSVFFKSNLDIEGVPLDLDIIKKNKDFSWVNFFKETLSNNILRIPLNKEKENNFLKFDNKYTHSLKYFSNTNGNIELNKLSGKNLIKSVLDKTFEKSLNYYFKSSKLDIVKNLNIDIVIVDEIHNFNNIFKKSPKLSIDIVEKTRSGSISLFNYKSSRSNTTSKELVVKNFSKNSRGKTKEFYFYSLIKELQQSNKELGLKNNTLFMSATPFTDSHYQVFSVLTCLNSGNFTKNNIVNMFEFNNLFTNELMKYDANHKGSFGYFVRVEDYTNAKILSNLITNVSDIKVTDEEIDKKRPKRAIVPQILYEDTKGVDLTSINTMIPQNKVQQEISDIITDYLEDDNKNKPIQDYFNLDKCNFTEDEIFNTEIIKSKSVNNDENDDENVEISIANISSDEKLKGKAILSQSVQKALTLSPYMILKNVYVQCELKSLPSLKGKTKSEQAKLFVENSPKILFTFLSIKKTLEYQTKQLKNKEIEKIGGQLVYFNTFNFTYGGESFNAFELFKTYLIDNLKEFSITKDKIDAITGSTKDNEKIEIKDKFNSGEILILMGTDSIKEGVDLQGNSHTLYILEMSFSPMVSMQLEGRIWRQGNPYEFVRIFYVLMYDSLDVFVYSKNAQKAVSIREMLNKGVYDSNETQFVIDVRELMLNMITSVDKLTEITYVDEVQKLKTKTNKLTQWLDSINSIVNIKNKIDFLIKNSNIYFKFYNKLIETSLNIELNEIRKKRNASIRAEVVKKYANALDKANINISSSSDIDKFIKINIDKGNEQFLKHNYNIISSNDVVNNKILISILNKNIEENKYSWYNENYPIDENKKLNEFNISKLRDLMIDIFKRIYYINTYSKIKSKLSSNLNSTAIINNDILKYYNNYKNREYYKIEKDYLFLLIYAIDILGLDENFKNAKKEIETEKSKIDLAIKITKENEKIKEKSKRKQIPLHDIEFMNKTDFFDVKQIISKMYDFIYNFQTKISTKSGMITTINIGKDNVFNKFIMQYYSISQDFVNNKTIFEVLEDEDIRLSIKDKIQNNISEIQNKIIDKDKLKDELREFWRKKIEIKNKNQGNSFDDSVKSLNKTLKLLKLR